MRDYSLYYREFDKYIQYIAANGHVPSSEDVDWFMESMFHNTTRFRAKGIAGTASHTDFKERPLLTPCRVRDYKELRPILDLTNLSYKDYVKEVKPVLMQIVEDAFGETGEASIIQEWDPKPYTFEQHVKMEAKLTGEDVDPNTVEGQTSEAYLRAQQKIAYIKSRVRAYNRETLPFRLRKTMHHEIAIVGYSNDTEHPWIARKQVGILNSEVDIDQFMRDSFEDSFRDLWVAPFQADNNNVGIVDIDFHGTIGRRDRKRVVKSVCARFVNRGYPVLVQYSGNNYHVWFGAPEGEDLGRIQDIKSTMRRLLGDVKNLTFNKTEAKVEGMGFVDESTIGVGKVYGMFLGLHYKPGKREESTGLVRVPLLPSEVAKFNEQVDSHPENVLLDFQRYADKVSNFFNTIGFGQGNEESDSLGSRPTCVKAEKLEPTHPLTKAINKWKDQGFESIRYADVEKEFKEAAHVCITPKVDGWLCGIHYTANAAHVVNGEPLRDMSSTQTRVARAKSVSTIMSTTGGIIMWDNHITRAFEEMCVLNGVDEALFVGELYEKDALGKTLGINAISSVLLRNEIDELSFRNLKFALLDVVKYSEEDVSDYSYPTRYNVLKPFSTSRVHPVEYQHVEEDPIPAIEYAWKHYVLERGEEGVVLHQDGKRYKVKRKFTVDAVIVAVSKETKAWQDNKQSRHSFKVAVAHKMKNRTVYVKLGGVNFGAGFDTEKQEELFRQVMGERTGERDDDWENAIPTKRYIEDVGGESASVLVEPKVVVEVEYDYLSDKTTPTWGMYYQSLGRKQTKSTRVQRDGWRLVPFSLDARKMVGPPTIKSVRPLGDKNPMNYRDINSEQGEPAGGFEIQRSPKRNPITVDIKKYPRLLRPIARMFPFVPYRGADVGQQLILDKNLRSKTFLPYDSKHLEDTWNLVPWGFPYEMFKKLRNIQRIYKDREAGGFFKDGTLYYGSTHYKYAFAPRFTNDVFGSQFLFHTHPDVKWRTGASNYISPEDIAFTAYVGFVFGVPWHIVATQYGFEFLRVHVKEESKVKEHLSTIIEYETGKSKVTKKKFQNAVSNYHKAINKIADDYKTALRNSFRILPRSVLLVTGKAVEDFNTKNKDFDIEYVFMPFPTDHILHTAKGLGRLLPARKNPGFYGVEKERDTLRHGNEGAVVVDGIPLLPTLKFEEEFKQAIARGRRADPDEKGYKIFLPAEGRAGDEYLWVGNFPQYMQTAKMKERGGPQNYIVIKPLDEHTEQLDMVYNTGKKSKSRSKDMPAVIAQNFAETPGIADPESDIIEPDWPRYDVNNILEKQVKNHSTNTKLPESEITHYWLQRNIKSNPPTGIIEWDNKVAEFRDEYKQWEADGISQPWMDYAKGMFKVDEVEMLEKGRLLLEAMEAYALSPSEERRIRWEYSSGEAPVEGTGGPLSGLLDELALMEDDEDDDEEFLD